MKDINNVELKVGDQVIHWLEGWNGHKERRGTVYSMGDGETYVEVMEDPNNHRCTHTLKVRKSNHLRKV